MNNHTKYETIGQRIGSLVDRKNAAYGDSFHQSHKFLKLLYPDGVPVEQYSDMLALVRMFDKMMRIANKKEAFDENPFKDLAGYAILKSKESADEEKADI